jgi:hypothetical protein
LGQVVSLSAVFDRELELVGHRCLPGGVTDRPEGRR